MSRPFPAYSGKDPYIFVSYAHADTDIVYPVLIWMKDQGYNVWYDEGIHPGAEWRDELTRAIRGAVLFVILFTPNSAKSNYCRNEIHFAIDIESNFLSVYLKPSQLPDGLQLVLGNRQAIFSYELSQIQFEAKVLSAIAGLLASVTHEPFEYPKKAVESPRLLVMPFSDSKQEDADFFADGLTEDIVMGLSISKWLRVFDIGTSLSFKNNKIAPLSAAAELGAAYVISGRIRRTDNRIRASFFLSESASGSIIWSKQFDRTADQIFEMEDEIKHHVLGSIEPEYLNHEASTALARTGNLEQWELVMKARQLFWRTSKQSTSGARELLLNAIELEESDVHAWGLLAMTHLNDVWHGWAESIETSLSQANRASREALRIDATDPWAHHTRGAYTGTIGELDQAEADLQRALSINPHFAAALGDMTRIRAFAGRTEGAIKFAERAIDASPRDPHLGLWYYWIAMVHFVDKNYTAALPLLEKTAAVRPDWIFATLLRVVCLAHLNDLERAKKAVSEIPQSIHARIVNTVKASGRNSEEGKGYRIEEHGIHSFLGCYFNAGEMMNDVFAELKKMPGLNGYYTSFDDAFVPQHSAVQWDHIDDKWTPWYVAMPANKRKYGTTTSNGNYHNAIKDTLKLIVSDYLPQLKSAADHVSPPTLKPAIDAFIQEIIQFLKENVPILSDMGKAVVEWLAKTWSAFKEKCGTFLPLLLKSEKFRHAYIKIDFFCGILSGFFKDEIMKHGFISIDHLEFKDWLRSHNVDKITIESPSTLNTPFITYNFPDGDMGKGTWMAAGCFLNWTLIQLGYCGSIIQGFTGGSGETILAPVYKVLKERGVKFEFFHKVSNLNPSSDKARIESVDVIVQTEVKNGAAYNPLIGPIGDDKLMSWPHEPRFEQLEEGDELKKLNVNLESWWTPWKNSRTKKLVHGDHFDHLVLGISLGALEHICPDLIKDKSKPQWKSMVDNIHTIQTQAMQIWYKKDVAELLNPLVKELPKGDEWMAGTYKSEIAGQVDFSHLIKTEQWPVDGPKGIFYLCGPKKDTGVPDFSHSTYPAQQHDLVKQNCLKYLHGMEPVMAEGVDIFDEMYTDDGSTGTDKFDFQFWRANIDPTERYVTSSPNSTKHRIEAGESGYSNLTLCGDWIYTGLNIGSVEGAVMGGRLASRAISKKPEADHIYGYDPFGLLSP